jgi:hypothetical protein
VVGRLHLQPRQSVPVYLDDNPRFVPCTCIDGILVNRAKGKQFQTTPPKKGHDTKDGYFDKEFIRLFENEPYTDLVVLRRRYRLQQKEKNISNAPFKPSSVPPKPYVD